MSEYSADAPLLASTNDKFHRWPFAKRVARVIASRTDPESIVIGINGAWGEGKTTVFNFIEEALINVPQVVCFRFKLTGDQIALARRLVSEGTSIPQASKILNVHRATLYRALHS
jgi:hypothetical protein